MAGAATWVAGFVAEYAGHCVLQDAVPNSATTPSMNIFFIAKFKKMFLQVAGNQFLINHLEAITIPTSQNCLARRKNIEIG
ncbi:hypothetical protein GCM10027346_31610 [Hymenobacter seoulensis]